MGNAWVAGKKEKRSAKKLSKSKKRQLKYTPLTGGREWKAGWGDLNYQMDRGVLSK